MHGGTRRTPSTFLTTVSRRVGICVTLGKALGYRAREMGPLPNYRWGGGEEALTDLLLLRLSQGVSPQILGGAPALDGVSLEACRSKVYFSFIKARQALARSTQRYPAKGGGGRGLFTEEARSCPRQGLLSLFVALTFSQGLACLLPSKRGHGLRVLTTVLRGRSQQGTSSSGG